MKKVIFIVICFLIAPNLFSQEIFRPDVSQREVKEITYKLPFFLDSQKIFVEIVDGYAIFQGDIILYNERERVLRDAGIEGTNFRWNNGTIPFVIEAGHPRRNDILQAIQLIQQDIPICLIQRNRETDFVEFVNEAGCASSVGRQRGRQVITIGNCNIGRIQHEILHAIGMHHEQMRSDRDDFVTINWQNIIIDRRHNFEKVNNTISICNYDFGSIMHYAAFDFSANGLPTIVPINPLPAGIVMGQRNGLSDCDIEGVRNLYPNADGCIARLTAEGRITFLRIHDIGTGWGIPLHNLDFEVIIKLDSEADKVFGFQLRNDGNEFSHNGMLDNLRNAFNHNLRVKIDYDDSEGPNNGQIIRVMNLK